MRLTLALALLALASVQGSGFRVQGSAAGFSRSPNRTAHDAPRTPNLAAAHDYLERRAVWWTNWPSAARDQGTVCVSCHTALPYMLARVAAGGADSTAEQHVLDSVRTRVRSGTTIAPYYSNRNGDDRKASESRGTEAVLNALVLASHDAKGESLSAETRLAFERMWTLQDADGGWPWLRFDLDPWEGPESAFFGATLAAVAVGTAPAGYQRERETAARVARLRSFLDANGARQPLANRAALLWAASKLPRLIDGDREAALVDELERAQRRDGGWSLEALMSRSLRTWFSPSDGYATGLATLALQPTRAHDAAERGRSWLARHQDPACACWPASSLNAKREPSSDAALFMTDAATGFAVLALAAR